MRKASLILLTALLAVACKKETCENYKPHVHVTQHASMDQYEFQPGTYWVYQNPETLALDSQAVISTVDNSFKGEYPSECSGGSDVQENRITVKSFLTNTEYDYLLIHAGLYKDSAAAGNHNGRLIYSGTSTYGDEYTVHIEVLPSLTLNGHTFTDVKKVLVKTIPGTSFNLSDHDIYMYFADSVGLIKWEEDLGGGTMNTWEIKSWSVVL